MADDTLDLHFNFFIYGNFNAQEEHKGWMVAHICETLCMFESDISSLPPSLLPPSLPPPGSRGFSRSSGELCLLQGIQPVPGKPGSSEDDGSACHARGHGETGHAGWVGGRGTTVASVVCCGITMW